MFNAAHSANLKTAATSIYLCLLLTSPAFAWSPPACLLPDGKTSPESLASSLPVADEELLARLVYAEGISTGCGDDPLVYEAIAWGVMNRVRLAEVSKRLRRAYGQGIHGVIFKKGQFNPAVSKRSPFSGAFLCPDHAERWRMARNAAKKAMHGTDNPLIRTAWEKRNGLSLVVNFYYPQSLQARGPFAPWEKNKSLRFIGDLLIEGTLLSARCVRFYRLNTPPGDLADRKP